MFAEVAPRYDLINHLLSFNIDRGWRRALRYSLQPALHQQGTRVLDLCCGTGDVLLDLQAESGNQVLGADFCHPMLVSAQQKARNNRLYPAIFEADALDLPIRSESLHAVSIAFGFRNLADYDAGLAEFHRILNPGGLLAILEFSHPSSKLVASAYQLYSRILLPAVGGLLSGSRAAYEYLPESIRKFPAADQLRLMMERAGFAGARYQLLSGGIAALHTGVKS